ncbi:MAG: hypothetical protein JNK76_13960 [Planctomycetales bacterium]|nr:hypothetical protein [Planctomycetales bacterium]
MTIFYAHVSMIGDVAVPLICPNCGAKSNRDGLTTIEKQYLLDATLYHRLLTEFRYLIAMKAIVDRYPGTQHPLLRSKLVNPGRGQTDEKTVSKLLNAQPELCEHLRRSWFRLDRRFPWVQKTVEELRDSILPVKVGCTKCDDQYVTLPDDFYDSIGRS